MADHLIPPSGAPSPSPGLPRQVAVVNVGLSLFGDAVRAQGAPAVDVAWRIPGGGRPELVAALGRAWGPLAEQIEAANREVCRRLDTASPLLTRVATVAQAHPALGERTLLHPGPPLDWEEFCDPLRRSARAAVMAEGWADSPDGADRLLASGEVWLEPANHHDTVVPMATVLGPSAPLLVAEDPQGGLRGYSGINQGPGGAWFGVESPQAVARLQFLRDVVAPVLAQVIAARAREAATGPVDIFSLAAQGLQMGDDAHMRTQASTNLLVRDLLPALAGLDDPRRVEVARFLAGDHLFFLNLAMAAARAAAGWAAAVPGSSIVTSMARNGTTFGIRVAGLERWFLSPSPPVEDALFHPGYGPADGAPDIGDSAVLETVGLGGAAAAASPAIATFLGGTMEGAAAATRAMSGVCAAHSSRFRIPFLDFAGSPLGIDVRRVVEREVTPGITTGILDATRGRGQVGAGVARAPLPCFQQALLALVESLDRESSTAR